MTPPFGAPRRPGPPPAGDGAARPGRVCSRVALYGFSDFEEHALASFLRLASTPAAAYETVRDIALAQWIVADADHAGVVAHIVAVGRTGDTLFVGRHAPAGAGALLPRPIDPLRVQRELDSLATERMASRGAGRSASTPLGRPAGLRALLIDDSPIALRFLQTRLQRCGVDAELADGSARALELLARGSFGYVFIDVELGEGSTLDGLALCQQIRRQYRHAAGQAPVLVMVSAHDGELDRVRGALAGCDHYLAKPVRDEVLRDVLAHRRPGPPDVVHAG